MNSLFAKMINGISLINKVETDAKYMIDLRNRIINSKSKVGGYYLSIDIINYV